MTTEQARATPTPGPWRVVEPQADRLWAILGADNHPVAVLSVVRQPARANTDLLAAATELLEVCELALAFHSADTQAFVSRYGHGMTTKGLCDRIRSVIAKAEGRTP